MNLTDLLSSSPQWLIDLGLIALAGLLGGVIGAEREFAGKPAGLRTHMLVCAAAALLMILATSVVNTFQEREAHNVIRADPVRVIHAIVIGISFLGAGTIVHEKGLSVEGLTTAASILLTAGIGIAVAVENIYLAIGTTIMALLVLLLVGFAERLVAQARSSRRQPKRIERTDDKSGARSPAGRSAV